MKSIADAKFKNLLAGLSSEQTSADLKKHVMLSWQARTAETLSDVLIVSGIQQHTGIYASEYSAIKDIEQDTGCGNRR